jgi:hypothetical protein
MPCVLSPARHWYQFSTMKAAADCIMLRDMYKYMHTPNEAGMPVPFSLSYVKLDRKKHTGGNLKRVAQCVATQVFDAPRATRAQRKAAAQLKVQRLQARAPRHSVNGTFNVRLLPSGLIRKVHYRLVTRFNNKRVIPS